MNLFDRLALLLTGLVAVYLIWLLYKRYSVQKGLHDIYYMLGLAVLFVSGVLLIIFGWDLLASPYVLTIASLIPLGISLGIMNQYFKEYKRPYAWFALLGFLAIAITSIADLPLKRLAVPLFHGIAGLVIFLGPIIVSLRGTAAKPFFWVGIGGALIGLGGIALAFLTAGKQFLFFSQSFVLTILAPLLLLMSLAFAWGFMKDIRAR